MDELVGFGGRMGEVVKNPAFLHKTLMEGFTPENLQKAKELGITESPAASTASYLQSAMENLKNSDTLKMISQPSAAQSAEVRAMPRTFNAMMKYLEEISQNTEMKSPVGARFSN
jgi:HAMP domain-containing protein